MFSPAGFKISWLNFMLKVSMFTENCHIGTIKSGAVAHPSIFRMFMKEKFDVYVLLPLAKSFQN